MSENLGTGVSYVSDPSNYNYDEVVFQKGKPPLDTELNLIQQIQNDLAQRRTASLPSGWLSQRPFYTDLSLSNQFYTQNPTGAIPEYALVNGYALRVTNTNTGISNENLIQLPSPPSTQSQVNGIFLEVWRALLSPNSSDNRPASITVIDSLYDVDSVGTNNAWAVGENGLIIFTENAGQTWNIQLIDTKQQLNSVYFINGSIGWVVGNNGTVARTSSGGARWNILTTDYVNNFNGVFAVTQQIAWIVGDTGLILKSPNGINWVAQTCPVTSNLRSVYFINTQVGWIAGDNGTILRTNDAGVNWVKQTSGITTKLNSIYFYDARNGFAVGDGGVILATDNGGATWYSQSSNVSGGPLTSVNYTDVSMAPALDEQVIGEEVSGQFTGSNKSFVTMHKPITYGDGNGTVTNLPSDVTVTVNGVEVLVDTVDGANGIIVLNQAPKLCDTVRITYWYKIDTSIFRGKAWITGAPVGVGSGIVLESDDIGNTWVQQNPNMGYDVNAIQMASLSQGWIVGKFSNIRYTVDSGSTWTAQLPNVIARQVNRVFNEGNVNTAIYLDDDSIHPDTNIETTKRVQVQYKIRVISDIDPFNYPDAGLGSQVVLGLGPNTNGTAAYENMGPINGDYGLWRAKCSNTVDGYCYAIPMFMVGRRNSNPFDIITNANGSYTDTNVRPDFLTGAMIAESDILDVRRRIIVPSTTELLQDNFNALMDNNLGTKFFRNTSGGDRYGTQILQMDTFTGNVTSIKSSVSVQLLTPLPTDPAGSLPDTKVIDLSLINAVGHQNPAYYSCTYLGSGPHNGQTVPGTFSGIGTSTITFTYNKNALTQAQDSSINFYVFKIFYVNKSGTGLTYMPSEPKLVQNSRASSNTYYYNGVFSDELNGSVLKQWESNISGYPNYIKVFPGNNSTSATRASTVEVHYFVRASTSNMLDILGIYNINSLSVAASNFVYPVLTISKVNNITAGFSYKIHNVSTTDPIIITTESGYEFVAGSVYEIVAQCITVPISTETGSTVNFIRGEKEISDFCLSGILETSSPVTPSAGEVTLDLSMLATDIPNTISGSIIGVSTTERIPGLVSDTGTALPFCWVYTGGVYKTYPVEVISMTGNLVTIKIWNWDFVSYFSGSAKIKLQVLIKLESPIYSDVADSITVGYFYRDYQSVSDLPNSITIKMVQRPQEVYVSDLGTGGSLLDKEPYYQPLINIPVNDASIPTDDSFYNIEPLQFSNFTIDGGFAQLPSYVPGNMSNELTLWAPNKDALLRYFYSNCSKDFIFRTEGLLIPSPRKMFVAALCRISSSSDNRFLKGEYVMVIFSRNAFMDSKENYTGFISNSNSVAAIYRLPNRPIVRA